MGDYRVYRLKPREKIGIVCVYMVVIMAVAILFYDNPWAAVAGIPGIYPVFRIMAQKRGDKVRRKLNVEFKEMLISLAANMAAGYSMEKALKPVYQEMEGLYQGKSYIQRELKVILTGLEMSTDIHVLLNDLADRSGLEDVREFARVSAVAGQSGGNIIKMMKKMVQSIEIRLEVEDEIDTMVTAKRMEYNIMTAMPFAIVLYMRVCNPEYMDVLYGNVFGAVAMTMCLVVVATMAVWGRKITDIRV